MELENDSQSATSDISDEVRRAATMKQIILDPLHADIAPESPSDEFTVNQHTAGTPIANLPSDSETTHTSIAPPEVASLPPAITHKSARWAIISGSIIVLSIVILTIYLITRR